MNRPWKRRACCFANKWRLVRLFIFFGWKPWLEIWIALWIILKM
jgi:hypothetical protein